MRELRQRLEDLVVEPQRYFEAEGGALVTSVVDGALFKELASEAVNKMLITTIEVGGEAEVEDSAGKTMINHSATETLL